MPFGCNPSVHTENSTDRYVDIYIPAAIERVKKTYIFGVLAYGILECHIIVQLLTGNTCAADAMPQYTGKLIIGKNIQFLYVLPLYVHTARITEYIHQA